MEKYRRDKKGNKSTKHVKIDLQHAIGEFLESQRENNKENEKQGDLIGEDNPADWDSRSK